MIKSLIATFFTRALSAGGGLVFSYVLALSLGADGVGLFSLGFAVVGLVAVLSKLGMDSAAVRFSAIAFSSGDKLGQAKLRKLMLSMGLCLSAIGAILMLISSEFISNVIFKSPALTDVLLAMAFLLPPYVLVYLNASLLKGIGKAWISPIFETGGLSFIVAAVLAVLWVIGINLNVTIATLVFSIVALFGFIASLFVINRVISKEVPGKQHTSSDKFSQSEFMSSLPDYAAIAVVGYLGQAGATLVMGLYLESDEIGIFSIAFKVALSVNFILVVVSSVTAPKFAVLHKDGKKDELQELVSKSAILVTTVCLPFALACLVAPKFILGFFGEEFIDAYRALQILVFAQLINVSTGSVSYLLNMTGHQAKNKKITIMTAVISIVLCAILTPEFSILGASIGISVGIILKNVLSAYSVHKLLDINVMKWSILR